MKNLQLNIVSGVNEINTFFHFNSSPRFIVEREIDYFDSKYIYFHQNSSHAPPCYLYQATSITAAPSLLLEITNSISAVTFGGMIRQYGGTLYIVVIFVNGANMEIVTRYTSNLVDWTSNTTGSIGGGYRLPCDIFKLGATMYFSINEPGAGGLDFRNFLTLANITTDTAGTGNAFCGGYIEDSFYHYGCQINTTTITHRTFDGTTDANVETLLTFAPNFYDLNYEWCLFWKQDNLWILHIGYIGGGVNTSFRKYDNDEGVWTNIDKSSAAQMRFGHIWDYINGEYRLIYLSENGSCYKMFPDGIAIIDTYTFLGMGWHDWGCRTTSTINQLIPTEFTARNASVTYTMEQIPICTIKSYVQLTEEYYILSDKDGNQSFEGFLDRQPNKGGFFIATLRHPLGFDLTTTVYEDAVNATPHAYIESLIDKYFKFTDYDATSIDDSFGAIDIPAFNGQSVQYVLRFFNILYKYWFYVEQDSLIVHWDDGTTASGKHLRYDTEVVINPLETPVVPADLATITGGYVDGDQLTSTAHSVTPGSREAKEDFPEIVTQGLLDDMSAAALEVWEQSQIYYNLGTAGAGLLQYGRTALFSTAKPLSIAENTYFIHSMTYDLVIKTGSVKLGKFMSLPFRVKKVPQKNAQLIDNIEKNIHWTWRDPASSDFEKTDLVDDTNWNDLDLSGIVGAKKMLVSITIKATDDAALSAIILRTNGNTSTFNRTFLRTQVSGIEIPIGDIIETDSAGKLEILCNPKPTDWSDITIVIRGYKDA